VSRRGLAGRKRTDQPHVEPWQRELERQILARIPNIDYHVNPLKLWLTYPTHKYSLAHPKQPEDM